MVYLALMYATCCFVFFLHKLASFFKCYGSVYFIYLIYLSCFMCSCMKSLQLCLTLCDPMDHSPPDSSVHGILQRKILEWVAMPSSRGSSRPQGLYPALPHCRWILYHLNHQGRPDSAIVIYFSGNPWVSYENPGGYVVTIHWKD